MEGIPPVVGTLVSVLIVSAVPLFVAVALPRGEAELRKIVGRLIGFASGAMLGAAFLHMLPESFADERVAGIAPALVLTGFFGFFILERTLWAHQHDVAGSARHGLPALAMLNVLGDAAHNAVDGMAIAAAYLTGPALGFTTALAVLLHEVPQEVGDYGILLHAGLSRRRAILWNLASALSAVAGAAMVLIVGQRLDDLAAVIVPFAAGGFIYIAAVDLIPQLREESVAGTASALGTARLLFAIGMGIALTSLPLLLGHG
jgi:zinc and cadmium transporter